MQQPYYGGYAPPPQGQPQPAPYGAYYSQQTGYYVPPPLTGYAPAPPPGYVQHMPQAYAEDDRGYRRDGHSRARGGRGRSRSPSQERRGRTTTSRADAKERGAPIVLPPLKPGEVTFALLVPAFGINNLLPSFKEIATEHTVQITLLDEAQGGSATRRSLRFIGTWDNLRPAQLKVLEVLKKNARNDLALSEDTIVFIPRDRAQNLTPESLSDIQNATNTTVEVFPATGGVDASVALLVISSRAAEGTPVEETRKNETDALARVKEVLNLQKLPSELPDDSESSYKIFIPIASRFAGSVIGKNASIVRELQLETKARINLSREGVKIETPTEVFRFVTAEGTPEQLRAAHERILTYVREAKERARADAKDGNVLRIPLSVPDQLIGVIIGRQGKVLRDLQEDTQTKIHIEHSGKDDRTPASIRLVEISGDPDKVEKAEVIVVERLTQAILDQPTGTSSRSRARSRSPSESRDRPSARTNMGTRPTVPAPIDENEEIDTMVIAVPIQQAGAVIGNRGETVRRICEESGARIHIEERDKLAPDATERAVTITGSTSQVAEAFRLIQTALSESAETTTARKPARDDNRAPRREQAPVSYGGYQQHAAQHPVQQQQYMTQQGPPLGYGQSAMPQGYYQQPPPQQQNPMPYYGNYPPRSGAPVQLPSLPPPQHLMQQQQQQPMGVQHEGQPAPQNSQFDLSILTQLAKNLPPIGSGVITQITGSPTGPPQPPNQGRYTGY